MIFRLAITTISIFAISACDLAGSTPHQRASIEYHNDDYYGRGEEIITISQDKNSYKEYSETFPKRKVNEYYSNPTKISIEEIDDDISKKHNSIKTVNFAEKENISGEKSKGRELIRVSQTKHKVKEGETLYAVSRKYNIPILPLIIVNDLESPYKLNKGQIINIPESRYHLVANDDTLYGISRKYGVDMVSIVKMNRLSQPYNIEIGQRLRLPFPSYEPKQQSKPTRLANLQSTSTSNAATSNANIKDKSEAKQFGPRGLAKAVPPKIKPTSANALNFNKKAKNIKFDLKEPEKNKFVFKDDGKFMWPLQGKIVRNFGKLNGEYHDGINISAPEGRQVKASMGGRVVYTGDSLKSYGNLVIIKHNNGLLTAYAHLNDVNVKKDQEIGKGETIGTVGRSGKVNSPQLYFAVRKGKEAKNPLSFLGS